MSWKGESQRHSMSARGVKNTVRITGNQYYDIANTPFKSTVRIGSDQYTHISERTLKYWNPWGGRDIIWVHMILLKDTTGTPMYVVGIEDINGETYYFKGFRKKSDAIKHQKESFKRWVTRYWGSDALKELKKPDETEVRP